MKTPALFDLTGRVAVVTGGIEGVINQRLFSPLSPGADGCLPLVISRAFLA
jgi:hypothetical protein